MDYRRIMYTIEFARGCRVDIMAINVLDVMLSGTAVALSIAEVQNREVEFQCMEITSGVAVLISNASTSVDDGNQTFHCGTKICSAMACVDNNMC